MIISKIIHHHTYLNGDTQESFHNKHLIFPYYVSPPREGEYMKVRSAENGEELTLTVTSVCTTNELNGDDCHIYSAIVLRDHCREEDEVLD